MWALRASVRPGAWVSRVVRGRGAPRAAPPLPAFPHRALAAFGPGGLKGPGGGGRGPRADGPSSRAGEEEGLEDAEEEEEEELLRRDPLLPAGTQRVCLIHPEVKRGPRKQQRTGAEWQVAEAEALVHTLDGWSVVESMVVPSKTPDGKLTFGKGTLEHLTERVRGSPEITAVFLNVERLATPTKKELEARWGVPVFDRFTVVLHIFRCNARTKEARLQVALAELPLLRSRLKSSTARPDAQGWGSRYIMGSGPGGQDVDVSLRARLKSAVAFMGLSLQGCPPPAADVRGQEATARAPSAARSRLPGGKALGQWPRGRAGWGIPVRRSRSVSRSGTPVALLAQASSLPPPLADARSRASPGESFVQVQQRLLKEKEMKIRKALERLRQKRRLLGTRRRRQEFPVIAVVGYTNCGESPCGREKRGKTTLIKALTGDDAVQPRDQLFATLDVTAHAGWLPSRMAVIYMDTIGFLSQLPHSLIESFSATLEDVAHSDLIVHVRDVTHPETELQKASVLSSLRGLRLPAPLLDSMLEVHNKTDLVPGYSPVEPQAVAVSALRGHGLPELKARLEDAVLRATGRQVLTLRVRLAGAQLSWLHQEATVQAVDVIPEAGVADVTVVISKSAYGKFRKLFPE
ncbi:putative GTP-binding protein 6 isoform X1 [Mustela putorius furo]|uniref:Putative GTP-binding protein 6 n=1 Tax=Mustela putorius furo TaxID=9669 RepID=A0A8U0T1Z7_MUSPF|nr:putative GTP-binding protein 6 isoform X1 [Mustela putorius furo]